MELPEREGERKERKQNDKKGKRRRRMKKKRTRGKEWACFQTWRCMV